MKIRTGFVSNSSSSSFVIGKNFMTEEQIDKFRKIIVEHRKADDESMFVDGSLYFMGEISMHVRIIPDWIHENGLSKYTQWGY